MVAFRSQITEQQKTASICWSCMQVCIIGSLVKVNETQQDMSVIADTFGRVWLLTFSIWFSYAATSIFIAPVCFALDVISKHTLQKWIFKGENLAFSGIVLLWITSIKELFRHFSSTLNNLNRVWRSLWAVPITLKETWFKLLLSFSGKLNKN